MAYRVLHVIPALAPRYGGPSAATVGMCCALRAGGASTLVATTDADGLGRLNVTVGAVTDYCGIPAIFFQRQAGESYKWSRPLDTWLRAHVQDFDVVHVHAVFSHSSLAAGRACRKRDVPYVVRPLGTLDPWSLSRHRRRKQLLFALGVRRLLFHAALIHYTSQEERRLVEERLPWLPRGVIVPLGINEDLFEIETSNEATDSPIVLTLSRLDSKKGIDVLIGAFHKLAGEGADRRWRLLIAGDGSPEYVAYLKRLAEAGPSRDRIEFLGWVDGPRRVDVLRRARLLALPSQQENFALAVVEAMACGVPVLVSPGVNLANEIADAGAGGVVPRTTEAWSRALSAALADEAALARRGARAREFAQRFRWPSVAEQLHAIYDDALGAHSAATRRRRRLVDSL